MHHGTINFEFLYAMKLKTLSKSDGSQYKTLNECENNLKYGKIL